MNMAKKLIPLLTLSALFVWACEDAPTSSDPADAYTFDNDADALQFPGWDTSNDAADDAAAQDGSFDGGVHVDIIVPPDSDDTSNCAISCPYACELVQGGDACSCDCPECGGLDYCSCLLDERCQTVEIECVCACDYGCPGYQDCDCGCGGGTYAGCAPDECEWNVWCGSDCMVVFDDLGCPECICPERERCGDLEYCDCRDQDECVAIVNGPTCGLDCECEGLECGCPSGEFVGCVSDTCSIPDECPWESADCEWAIGEDGCAECLCDEPPAGCPEIEDYCECAETNGCQVVTNALDCGYDCECDSSLGCVCSTEFLACQPATCPSGFADHCDLESGRCELVWNEDGCLRCRCLGGDDVCTGLDYCSCLLNEHCEEVTDSCICPCDYECPGYEDCVCDCGGGDYLGCQAMMDDNRFPHENLEAYRVAPGEQAPYSPA